MLLDLKGKIRTVEHIDQTDFGDIEMRRGKFDIRISLKKNKRKDEFTATLLHELLHLWLTITMKVCKLKITLTEEHEIIQSVESVVMYFVYLNLKSRRKK